MTNDTEYGQMASLLDRIMGVFAPSEVEAGADVKYVYHRAFKEQHHPRGTDECWYCQRWDEYRGIVGPFPGLRQHAQGSEGEK